MSPVSPSAFRTSSIPAVPSSRCNRFLTWPVSPPANYSVCQTNNTNATLFQCNATGRHKDAVIEWRSDGRLLTDSAQTRITHSITTVEGPSGFYLFSSELAAELQSPPTCNITARGLSTVVSGDCTSHHAKRMAFPRSVNRIPFHHVPRDCKYLYLGKFFFVSTVKVCSLILTLKGHGTATQRWFLSSWHWDCAWFCGANGKVFQEVSFTRVCFSA